MLCAIVLPIDLRTRTTRSNVSKISFEIQNKVQGVFCHFLACSILLYNLDDGGSFFSHAFFFARRASTTTKLCSVGKLEDSCLA